MTAGGLPLLLTHPACEFHQAPEHPERPERLAAIYEAVAADPDLRDLPRRQPEMLSQERIAALHNPGYVEAIFQAGALADERGLGSWLDPDTWLGPSSLDAALASAGGAAATVDTVLNGEHLSAFCFGRPPGHHATAGRAMGFCLFNNVALAAQAALDRGLERVAIVDFDVHHGNGTQDIFYSRSDVLYMSCHQYPLYPGTGAANERGTGRGEGYTVNVPMAAGGGQVEYLGVFDEAFLPALREYRPELLLVSAGFDAHHNDPLAQMELDSSDYGLLSGRLKGAAADLCEGRSAWVLEGGYDLRALAESTVSVLRDLSGLT